MIIQSITQNDKELFNSVVSHPLQSYEWGEFRKKTGITVIRRGLFEKNSHTKIISGFQLTIHKIPRSPWTIGYLPKGTAPTEEMIVELQKIGKEYKCIFIQLEPDTVGNATFRIPNLALHPAIHPLFTKYTFFLDLTKSEEDLLKNMHPKTRYNIKVAIKHGVHVAKDDSDKAFTTYLTLTEETTKRQGFYAHTKDYHGKMWETLGQNNMQKKSLSAHLFLANYQNHTLAAWIVFVFHDTLYYPYGASSNLYRETMASNLMMWEIIRWGKKQGLKKFDMWGALGPTPNRNDPWYGFHRFKQGYGATLTEFVGSFDLVVNPILYQGYKIADKTRWLYLRLKKRLPM